MQIRNYYRWARNKLRSIWGYLVHAPNFSVVVFQMGKVGSKTVQESLVAAYRKLHQPVDIYHSHILTGFDEAEMLIRNERPNPEPSLRAIIDGKNLRKLIDETPSRKWRIISLVRDPVARNVATFFQNLQELVPEWSEHDENDPMLIQKLQQAFLNVQTIHSEPVRWFDEQLLPVCGMDVFAESFPHEVGYKIYNPKSRTPVLLIRLEDLNQVGATAIQEFLGLDNFGLINTNIGEEKDYAQLYGLFKQNPLPNEYIQAMYTTKYARTFYTETELSKFSLRWKNI